MDTTERLIRRDESYAHEKKVTDSQAELSSYPVMEHFYTLQGEGYYAGQAAYFVRLGGCTVGCVWCDVKESWDAAAHPFMTVSEILSSAAAYPARIVVITGGEPAMYDLWPLCEAFHRLGFRVHLETSGAYAIQGDIDWITLSPKKFKAPLEEVLQQADELKVVVYHRSDVHWAEQHASKVPISCKRYLQPEWGRRMEVTPLIIQYITEHPSWQLSLQTHKYIGIP